MITPTNEQIKEAIVNYHINENVAILRGAAQLYLNSQSTVAVAGERKERCKFCGEMVSDWVDPDWAGGRVCRSCETKHEPVAEGETPRCEAAKWNGHCGDFDWTDVVSIDVARQLERELNAALKRAEAAEQKLAEFQRTEPLKKSEAKFYCDLVHEIAKALNIFDDEHVESDVVPVVKQMADDNEQLRATNANILLEQAKLDNLNQTLRQQLQTAQADAAVMREALKTCQSLLQHHDEVNSPYTDKLITQALSTSSGKEVLEAGKKMAFALSEISTHLDNIKDSLVETMMSQDKDSDSKSFWRHEISAHSKNTELILDALTEAKRLGFE